MGRRMCVLVCVCMVVCHLCLQRISSITMYVYKQKNAGISCALPLSVTSQKLVEVKRRN